MQIRAKEASVEIYKLKKIVLGKFTFVCSSDGSINTVSDPEF